ncbi:cation transporter [Microbacterium fluvii]|uniref:Cation transporter n=1 Tax=Microbacterium fluvii TaxID=415215 RepID=A0ABW2HGH8_9MICO|nr:cation transporter [Microbacterium fluvii]MCU4673837.1 cation transporter [Microbacterium fluvii]
MATSESRALAVSLVATAVLGGGAVVWGVAAGARVILFDGVYMLAGIVLIAVSMMAARAAGSSPSAQYPFGRHAATPLAVALQGAALLGTLLYGAADAVVVIFAGGSDAAAGSVLAYGVVSAVASLAVLVVLRPAARVSSLANAEAVSWRAGMLLSAVIAIGGAAALLVSAGPWAAAADYVDPVLVLIACALIAPMAISLVRDGVRELLEAAPPADIRDRIDLAVAEGVAASGVVGAERTLPPAIVRATKLGQRLYVEVDFVVDRGVWSVDDEDAIRHGITERLEGLDLLIWATVELTTDPGLAAAE